MENASASPYQARGALAAAGAAMVFEPQYCAPYARRVDQTLDVGDKILIKLRMPPGCQMYYCSFQGILGEEAADDNINGSRTLVIRCDTNPPSFAPPGTPALEPPTIAFKKSPE